MLRCSTRTMNPDSIDEVRSCPCSLPRFKVNRRSRRPKSPICAWRHPNRAAPNGARLRPNRPCREARAMTLKDCQGNPLKAEVVLGWGRQTVALGLAEKRSGIICLGAQSAFSGRNRWEEQHRQSAQALRHLADAHAQPDPTFRTSVTYTRLTSEDWQFFTGRRDSRRQPSGCSLWT